MASPFGTSNQGGYQGGFGGAQQQSWGGGQGFGGGFQPQQSFGGFGGGGGFGGFGGGGFQPQGFGFGGGFGGGFQQQFNPYQGGFGGFGGFGGGYNPMFGGIGGLGFNPMMGQNFGMPMGGFGSEDRPGQWESFLQSRFQPQYNPDRANESGMPMQGFGGMGAAAAQAQRTPIQFDEKMPTEQDWNRHAASAFYAPNTDMEAMKRDFMSRPMRTPRNLEALFGQSTADQPRQPLYGGIGGLGFNPMMGPQFGMPMRTMPSNLETLGPPTEDQLREHKAQVALMRQRAVDEFNPMMGPQFGMPMQGFGFNPNARQEQQRWQQHVQNSLAMGVDPRSEEQIARGQSLKDWLSGRSV